MLKAFCLLLSLALPFSSFAIKKSNPNKNNLIVTAPEEKYYGDDDARPPIQKTYANEIEDTEKYLNGFFTFVAQFKQSNSKGEISYGKLFINKPEKIRCEYINPTPILLIINGQKITYYDKDLDEVSYTSTDINALKLLALEKIAFNKLEIVQVEKEPGFISFSIKEHSLELKQDLILTLKFSYPKVELKQLNVITEDSEIAMVFEKIYYNQKLGKELFYFHKNITKHNK